MFGNPNLNAEESFNTDLRLAWFGKRLFFETDVFRNKNDVGSGEAPIPEATLLSAAVGYELRPGLSLSLSGGNLLDEEYVSSADDKAPLAEGRSFGLAVEWRR